MSARRARLCWVLAATYLGCSLAPFAHGLLTERESCEKCLAARGAGTSGEAATSSAAAGVPRLTHDHSPHEHDQCLICALGQIAAATSEQVHFVVDRESLRLDSRVHASATRDLFFLESQPARAPPSVS